MVQLKPVINIQKADCPDCGATQSALRRPKSLKQLLFGGWTCTSCGCSMDRFGKKYNKK